MFIVTFDIPFEAAKAYIAELIDQLNLTGIILMDEEEFVNDLNREIKDSFNLKFDFFISEGPKNIFLFQASRYQHARILVTYANDSAKCWKMNDLIIESINSLYQGIYLESDYASWQDQEFIICYNYKGGLKYTNTPVQNKIEA
jgi:hypothetical protein